MDWNNRRHWPRHRMWGVTLVAALAAQAGWAQSALAHNAASSQSPPPDGKSAAAVGTVGNDPVGFTVIRGEDGKPDQYKVSTHQPVEPYRLGPSDEISINVWQNVELSRDVIVRPDGQITEPLIGDLNANGLTVDDIRDVISRDLSKYIQGDPHVTVTLKFAGSHRYSILGKVMKPGPVPIDRPVSVLDAIAAAGGLTEFAKRNQIYVLRQLPGSLPLIKISVRYDDIIKGRHPEQNIDLIAGDVVMVP